MKPQRLLAKLHRNPKYRSEERILPIVCVTREPIYWNDKTFKFACIIDCLCWDISNWEGKENLQWKLNIKNHKKQEQQYFCSAFLLIPVRITGNYAEWKVRQTGESHTISVWCSVEHSFSQQESACTYRVQMICQHSCNYSRSSKKNSRIHLRTLISAVLEKLFVFP